MSYLFDFSSFLYKNDEKQASPVKSKEEEKVTKAERNQNEEQEQESEDIMGSASRKGGWLESWQFWKKNDSGPFSAFRNKNNRPTGAFTFRKDVNEAIKPKERGKGEGSKDVNLGRGSSESGKEEGQSKAAKSITKSENMDGGKSSASASDQEKDVPLVTYNERPNGGKDVALNMKKVQALRDKKQNDSQTQRGSAASGSVGVLEEKYSPMGQAQPTQVDAMKSKTKGPVPSTVASSSPAKQKIDATTKTITAIRQLPTTQKVQKRTPANAQVVSTSTKATRRQENVPKVPSNTKIVAGKKNAERKPIESKKIDKKNELKKVGEAKRTVVKKNVGVNQAQKAGPQKPVVPRANCVKIDEKPSISSCPSRTVVKTAVDNEVKQKDAATKQVPQVPDCTKIAPSISATQKTESQKNVATEGPGLDNATVPKSSHSDVPPPCPMQKPHNPSCTNNVIPTPAQGPAHVGVKITQNSRPENQRLTRLQNPGSQVSPKRNIASGLKNCPKPSTSHQPPQQQHVGLQSSKVSQSPKVPQSSKSHNLGPQCPKPGPQDLRVPVQESLKSQSPTQSPTTRNLESNHIAQVGPKSLTPNLQTLNLQQSHMQSPMPQNTLQQSTIPQNPSQIGPPVKRPYSEVVNPQQLSPQPPIPKRNRPEGVIPQASPIQTKARPKQPVNRRRAPGLAKLVKPAGETPPESGETTPQDPKEPVNVPKGKILCSRDGRKVIIEPNMPVTLPGTSVNSQGSKNVSKAPETEKKTKYMPKTKPKLPGKQAKPATQLVKQVKPVMKDASTSTLPPSTLVDTAVQVPDEEENAGDEIQSLLVKRPWDTERVMKMQVLLDEKLVVIGRMKEMFRKQRDELKSTKKHCKELETVIKASNMQGKPQLVTQVNELTDLRNELVTEVTNLTIELEKERTIVKSLRTELVDVRAQLTAARKKGANPTNQ